MGDKQAGFVVGEVFFSRKFFLKFPKGVIALCRDALRRAGRYPARAAHTDATDENIYLLDNMNKGLLAVLPGSLNQALTAMEQDEVVRQALGAHTFKRFISAKRLEWEDFRLEVTNWELEKYLPNY